MFCSVPTARIVLFGDTHLGFDLPAKPRTDRRRRGDDFFANYRRVLDYAAGTRPDALVHAGDVFHRSRVHPAVVEQAFEALASVASLGVAVLVVPGNHDRSKLPPSLWLGHPGIHVFDRPRTVLVRAGGMNLAMAGFPFAWGDLRTAFVPTLEATGLHEVDADARFLCMHHTVAGASVGPNGYTFRNSRDVVGRPQLPANLAAVLSGHIHRSQVLDGNHPPVYYPGSTERTSFAERDERKGFFELTVSSHRGSANVAAARFVELPARPMMDLVIPAATSADGVPGLLRSAACTYPADAVVRVTAEGQHLANAEQLGAASLRAAFPPTMNVQLAGGMFRASR